MKYNKIIIWGYPIYSHTHSYVHHSYYKAFKYLGYDVYWFDDENYPKDFDFNNCLFIGEGFADKNIPINKTSCYMIMHCPSPLKYSEAGRYIDIRMGAVNFKDHVQEYSLNKNEAEKIGPGCYFVPKSTEKIQIKNDFVDYVMDDFDKVYISWATNLLPYEFDESNIYLSRENVIHFCGTISHMGVCENRSNLDPFINECEKNGVKFIHNCPWTNPISNEEVIKKTQASILGIDIRGKRHVSQRLLTCRLFKNISYGHLGLTNSEEFYIELDGNCVYNPNSAELFYDGMSNKNNFKLIKNGMQLVKENHTYINRINSYLSII